jgi:hypothetical protein
MLSKSFFNQIEQYQEEEKVPGLLAFDLWHVENCHTMTPFLGRSK